ncbi:MAG: NADH-quinone oxidoreductase subunit L [Planctomycetaceae bacterium]
MDIDTLLPTLLGLAWLLPLASFVVILFAGPRLGHHGKGAATVATAAIVGALALSLVAFVTWLANHPVGPAGHAEGAGAAHASADGGGEHAGDHADDHAAAAHGHEAGPHYSGDWYTLYEGGRLRLSIGWYIDSLTVLMFVMITFIATCIHVYASGYMHDELHDVTDHEVHVAGGGHLHRPGRFHRFFQALSLFCFSMLGIVIAGNLAMVFIFWELVGICSWFLIGFYYERKSASSAANKAFIVNRIGDFGMLIGLMALWGALGTLDFGDSTAPDGRLRQGLFSQVRPEVTDHALWVPDGMVKAAAADNVGRTVLEHAADPRAGVEAIESKVDGWREIGFGRWLLFIAGLGIFCGCVGKSAQFPLFVWLPDAMEGPTPVSALVHSATMVAAGVYLVGRFYPVLTPEALLVIAYVGAVTLFIAATIALVANDIKRVLAYSTVSQLGYMMLALGVGGWVAGLFHLVTHAFFKSLLFLCSGSVIHACHTNDMRKMGGLLRVMPWTGWTMLVGCLAIIGAGVPFLDIGLSGYYSKDSILAQALVFARANPGHAILFWAVAGGAALTAFYMFRLWFMTFLGQPRDHHVHEHAHESPPVMTYPLVALAILAVVAGWTIGGFGVANMIEQARPVGTGLGEAGRYLFGGVTIPAEHDSHAHDVHVTASLVAFATAASGVLLAAAMYVWRVLSPAAVASVLAPLYGFLANRWYFDELYRFLFVKPVLAVAALASATDKGLIDRIIDGLAWGAKQVAGLDAWIDRNVIDSLVDGTANATWNAGLELKRLQTGRLRQYVMFIALGTVALFILASMLFRSSLAG